MPNDLTEMARAYNRELKQALQEMTEVEDFKMMN